MKIQSQQIGIIDESVIDDHKVFGQKLLVLGDIVPSFINGNAKTETILPEVNNVIKFLYNLGSALRGRY